MRCLTIGSAMVDVIATIADRDVERMTLHNATLSFLLVEQGRKIEAESISIHVGGGGVNVAVALRRLGSPVDVLVKLGIDVDAARVRDHLAREDIGMGLVKETKALPTGSAVLIASHDKDAAIYTQRGANTALKHEEVAAVRFGDYALVHIAPLSGASAECLKLAVTAAAEAGAFVVVNPGIRQITTRSPDLLSIAGKISLLAINAREAAALAPALAAFSGTPSTDAPSRKTNGDGTPRLVRDGLRLNDSTFALSWFFKTLAGCGAKRVLVTNGAEGSYLYDGKSLHFCPVAKSRVKGTAGAGDAFCSTLGQALASELEPGEALRRAAANAASVVSHPDAQTGLLDAERLKAAVLKSGLKVWRGVL